MDRTHRIDVFFDKLRQLMYATGLVVAVGSIWTVAWANSLDGRTAAASRPTAAAVARAAEPLPTRPEPADGDEGPQ